MGVIIRFYTQNLCSKWGFDDGDMLSDEYFETFGTYKNPRRFLPSIIKKFVIPKIEDKIVIVDIETCHNPIRTKSINEIVVDWYDPNIEYKLTPKYVDVDINEIMDFIKKEEVKKVLG